MKKLFTLLFASTLFFACNSNKENESAINSEEKAQIDSAYNNEDRDSLFDAAAAGMDSVADTTKK